MHGSAADLAVQPPPPHSVSPTAALLTCPVLLPPDDAMKSSNLWQYFDAAQTTAFWIEYMSFSIHCHSRREPNMSIYLLSYGHLQQNAICA